MLTESLDEQPNRQWSASEVVAEIPRQSGKGSIMEARQLAGLFLLGEPLQIHTAHEFKTTFEHFLRIVNLVEGCPDLDRLVQRVRRGAGEQAIELKTGERLRFVARSNGSGRGFSAGTIYLDEAYALTPAAMGALVYAMAAQPNPQIWAMSSGAMVESEVLLGWRSRADAGIGAERLLYAGWSAERDPDDLVWQKRRRLPEVWAQANPGFPHRLRPSTVQAELDLCGDSPAMLLEFDRERLGITAVAGQNKTPFTRATWVKGVDRDFRPEHPVWCVEVAPDRSMAVIGLAGHYSVGTFVEVADSQQGIDWVLPRIVELVDKYGGDVVIDPAAGAGTLAKSLQGLAHLVYPTAREVAHASTSFLDAAEAGRITHAGQDSLDVAVMSAAQQVAGDSWRWARSNTTLPLMAVSLARWRVETATSIYDSPDFIVSV